MSGIAPRTRVLVVDNSTIVRRYMREALERAQFAVEEAFNGVEALEKILAHPFDLLVVDVNMPKMDGYAFLRALRGRADAACGDPGADDQHGGRTAGHRRRHAAGANYLPGEARQPGGPGPARQRPDRTVAMSALIEQFIIEARELVTEASDDLLAYERAPDDRSRLERVFRAFHTLKGGAAIAGLPDMSRVLHAGEDLLDGLRKGEIVFAASLANALLGCIDQVGQWVDALARDGKLPDVAAERATALAEGLRRHVPRRREAAAAPPDKAFDWAGAHDRGNADRGRRAARRRKLGGRDRV